MAVLLGQVIFGRQRLAANPHPVRFRLCRPAYTRFLFLLCLR